MGSLCPHSSPTPASLSLTYPVPSPLSPPSCSTCPSSASPCTLPRQVRLFPRAGPMAWSRSCLKKHQQHYLCKKHFSEEKDMPASRRLFWG
ncbi:hypothetical protein O181_088993 [Austropuccinia psidii MF-1]|uniref:Uncharacterized protein n=1 Tax=Austropuccinia psidii MF-1 TaxID=1389203 RepID=A0A9Q3ISG6_9BASI|nr:hypothetical protein [Austropuccinia psidii MF-1]